MKNLTFDANSIKIGSNSYGVSVDLDTRYPEEVLNNFTLKEIVSHFSIEEILEEIGEMEVKNYFGIEDCE